MTEHVIKVPVGTWPKDETLKLWGSWNRQFVLQGLEGFALRGMTEILGVSTIISHRPTLVTVFK